MGSRTGAPHSGISMPFRPPAHSPYALGGHLLREQPGPSLASQGHRHSGPSCALQPGALLLCRPPAAPVAAPLPEVPGAWQLRGLLSAGECAQVLLLAEGVGFEEEPSGVRQGVAFVVDDGLNQSLFKRVEPFLPKECLGGELRGLDRRWVVERCEPCTPKGRPVEFRESRPATAPVSEGDLAHQEDSNETSLATVLLFLNQAVYGGEVCFWIPRDLPGDFSRPAFEPKQGSALLFFHGQHPLSLLHEDLPVRGGARHVLKCEVLYQRGPGRPEDTEEFKMCVREHPNIYQCRLHWEHQVSRGLGDPLLHLFASLRLPRPEAPVAPAPPLPGGEEASGEAVPEGRRRGTGYAGACADPGTTGAAGSAAGSSRRALPTQWDFVD